MADYPSPDYVYNDPVFERDAIHHLDRVWTVAEVAELFDLNPSTVRRACERGQVLARKSGATWLINASCAIARWHEGRYSWD